MEQKVNFFIWWFRYICRCVTTGARICFPALQTTVIVKIANALLFGLAASLALVNCKTPEAIPVVKPAVVVPVVSEPTANTGSPPKLSLPDYTFLPRLIDSDFITGQTQVSVVQNPLANWLAAAPGGVNLGNLQNGGAPVMLVFGDGLAAGWRDGGLFREGQQTAFPNLIAIQMGLKDFRSPLFDEAVGNGTGYLKLVDQVPGPRWQEVSNSTGILSQKNTQLPDLSPYTGGLVHNKATPKVGQGGLGGRLSPEQNGWTYGPGTNRPFTDDMPFLWRMFPGINKYKATYQDVMMQMIADNKPKLVLSVFEYDSWTDVNVKNEQNTNIASWNVEAGPLGVSVAGEIRRKNGIESITFTLPDFRHQAFFNYFTIKALNELPGTVTITTTRTGYIKPKQSAPDAVLLATKNVEEVFNRARKGDTFLANLTDKDVINAGVRSPVLYNQRIRREATQKNVGVVDLEQLYRRIYEGNYVTDDGYKIDGSPTGNFFSGDGLYPSAIGNAVIANETIKVINQRAQAHIPLINVGNFARSLGK